MLKRLIGLFILATGVLWLFANLDMVDFDGTFKYIWPSVIILVGLLGIYEEKRLTVINTIITLIGLNFLLLNMDIINESLIRIAFWPIIFILIGINLISTKTSKVKTEGKRKTYTAIFSGIEERNTDDKFIGCEITTIFGGADIDFSSVKLKGDKAHINITSIFGGGTLILPRDYKIIVNGTPIFGGCDNRLSDSNSKATKEIIVDYTVIFGGIELKD